MIDTAQKRRSLIGMGRVWTPYLPAPDGAIDTAADRAQLAWLYAEGVAAPVTDDHVTVTVSDASAFSSTLSDQATSGITLAVGTDSVITSDASGIQVATDETVVITTTLT